MDQLELDWLTQAYPGLKVTDGNVTGLIEFKASYDSWSGLFTIVVMGNSRTEVDSLLSGSYQVRIEGPHDRSSRILPLLYIEGVAKVADRHINQTDLSACLCSPLETDEFLYPTFSFQKFLEELVIPFLYGQVFFETHGRWPWPDYAHGATGLLEAYSRNSDPSKATECIEHLSRDVSWAIIKSMLIRQKEIKGHTPCLCSKHDQIRRCHPEAWSGIRHLQRDVQSSRLVLPE